MLCYSYKFMRIRSKIANQHLFSTIFIVFFFTLSYLVLQFFYALLLCKVVFINISLFFLLSNTQINLKSPLTLFDEIKKKLKKKNCTTIKQLPNIANTLRQFPFSLHYSVFTNSPSTYLLVFFSFFQ